MTDSEKQNDKPIVQIENLHVRFGTQHVLRDINLTIPCGQTLAIIGESGCGKTVLLKTMIGLIKPTSGRVRFDGQDFNKLNDRELSKQRTRFGFVFQQAALFDSLTIGQNVAFPLKQHQRLPRETVEKRVLRNLAEVGLPESVVFKKPAELSGGMRKRVGLARALAMEPELVLYDEPTTGLDPIMSDVINELILQTQRRTKVTGVVITHDMVSARKVADRIIMIFPVARLGKGEAQILFDGSPDEIDQCSDKRVLQFIRGEAGERLNEMRHQRMRSA